MRLLTLPLSEENEKQFTCCNSKNCPFINTLIQAITFMHLTCNQKYPFNAIQLQLGFMK